jgi:hypothetical protein
VISPFTPVVIADPPPSIVIPKILDSLKYEDVSENEDVTIPDIWAPSPINDALT